MSEFTGRETDFAFGSVRGVRVFDFLGLRPGSFATAGDLAGQYGAVWLDGENAAKCGNARDHAVPDPGCGCGFWAYWELDVARLHFSPSSSVLAVVEGYGRTLIGERGFRSAKARIIALHLAFDFTGRRPEPLSPGWHPVTFEPPPEVAGDNEAMKATCENLLGERYPSASIYATQRAMLALHPPTTAYLPSGQPQPDGESGSASPSVAAGRTLARVPYVWGGLSGTITPPRASPAQLPWDC